MEKIMEYGRKAHAKATIAAATGTTALLVGPGSAMAAPGDPPVVSYTDAQEGAFDQMSAAIPAALLVFGVIFGVIVGKRLFKTVAK